MTARQQKALAALLTSPTREKAAEAAGITSKTLRSYLAIPEFQEEYKKAFAGLVEDATRQAQQALAPALSTLQEIVEDGGEAAQARVSAARSILEYSLKLTEQLDVLERIKALEDTVKEGTG